MPGGVTEASSSVQLKAALKEWGLPISGKKADLWQRLQDQVRPGGPLRDTPVQGATGLLGGGADAHGPIAFLTASHPAASPLLSLAGARQRGG